MKIARGREASVYASDGVVIWVADGPDTHPEFTIGWELCRVRLSPPHFPEVYSVTNTKVEMEFVLGDPPVAWNKIQATAILDALKAANITHRDIRLDNLIERLDGNWCLIDFGWACDLDYTYPAPRQVGGRHRGPDGPDDTYAMSVVESLLTKPT